MTVLHPTVENATPGVPYLSDDALGVLTLAPVVAGAFPEANVRVAISERYSTPALAVLVEFPDIDVPHPGGVSSYGLWAEVRYDHGWAGSKGLHEVGTYTVEPDGATIEVPDVGEVVRVLRDLVEMRAAVIAENHPDYTPAEATP